MTVFSLNIEAKAMKLARKSLGSVMQDLYFDIRAKSPVKSGKFIRGHENLGIKEEDGKLIGTIRNEVSYAQRVEFGFRKRNVNWHMSDGTIYHDRGANTYGRAIAKIKKNLGL